MNAQTQQAIDSMADLVVELCRNRLLDAVRAEANWNALPIEQRDRIMASLRDDVGTLVTEVVWQAVRRPATG